MAHFTPDLCGIPMQGGNSSRGDNMRDAYLTRAVFDLLVGTAISPSILLQKNSGQKGGP